MDGGGEREGWRSEEGEKGGWRREVNQEEGGWREMRLEGNEGIVGGRREGEGVYGSEGQCEVREVKEGGAKW